MFAQTTFSVVIALLTGLLGIGYVLWQFRQVLAHGQGNERMQQIAGAIQEGASAFLGREYRVLAVFVAIVATIITLFLSWQTALAFVSG
ncbi:MAG: sodium-translocating pyrophosphatase, partial [Gammaproteobacteria bacterium]|nr:sodium-translocating pyrophosphatase [Gammaproteobacteria bacterium]